MLPGPTLVLACPTCSGKVSHMTLASGNTFGAKFYTDGYTSAPMLSKPPCLVECPHCETILRLKDFEKIDSFDRFVGFLSRDKSTEAKERLKRNQEKEEMYGDLPRYAPAKANDYFTFSAERAADKKEELFLRTLGWQQGNHTRRSTKTPQAFDMLEEDNLRRLLHLGKGNKKFPQVLVAEAYRELGLFQDAEKVLSNIDSASERMNDFERTCFEVMPTLISQEDRLVQEVKFD
jgi:hypothetical protein